MVDVAVVVHDFLPRKGIQAALDSSDVARVVACMGDVDGLDSALQEHEPEVLILDARFRREDPDLLPTLARRHPSCRVLVLVPHKASECAFRNLLSERGGLQLSPAAASRIDECCLTSLRGEARGCLAREAGADDVVRSVTAVAEGKVVAAGWLNAFADVGVGQADGRPSITARELEVMALLAEGLGNKAIARKLGIREQTVKNHLARLMTKLGLSSRAQVGLVAARYHVHVTSIDTASRG